MTAGRRVARGVALVALTSLSALVPLSARAAATKIGRVAYITSGGVVELTTVMSDGTTTAPQQLGPLRHVTAPETVRASDLVASSDGTWLAWRETVSKPSEKAGTVETGGDLVVGSLTTGQALVIKDRTLSPLGFAGDQLVVSGAHIERLSMSPAPHLVRIRDVDAVPMTAYPRGVVDVVPDVHGSKHVVEYDLLRLTNFAGQHTRIHQYTVGRSYRSVAAGVDVVSPDGRKLLVERGNHQDFAGLGPSSLFDEYALSTGGGHPRRQLGHYGTDAADWRLASASFVGPDDTPWLSLHSGPGARSAGDQITGVVVRYARGRWQLEMSGAIDVSGDASGYVLIQPGQWEASADSPDGGYLPTPTGTAVLRHGTTSSPTSIEASQLLFLR